MAKLSFHVNGQEHQIDCDPEMPLIWLLRDHLGLTGTKFGCGIGECGSCTILLDGEAERSCSLTAGETAGKPIVTIEGLADLAPGAEPLHPLQKIWIEEQVPQCGYCQPGQLLTAASLLQSNPRPSEAEISSAMSEVLCRCGTYPRIKRAVARAAKGDQP